MFDVSVIVTVVPPILTAAFAYIIARKRNLVSERINKAKISADIQTQALNIVRGVMVDMRDEFRREIDELRTENKRLKEEISNNSMSLKHLQEQLTASDILIDTLRSEISTLQKTVKLYEAENERLKKG
jgi:chromosome segregation ATPase